MTTPKDSIATNDIFPNIPSNVFIFFLENIYDVFNILKVI
jgi:hypothetical protein